MKMKRILIGISGASGAPIAIAILQRLKENPEVESHLIVTEGAKYTIAQETSYSYEEVQALADFTYENHEIWQKPASGSVPFDAMLIVPCSMKTLAGIHSGYAENLLLRAADVSLKEGRSLVLVPREMPLSPIHLRNMQELSMMGVKIVPPMVAYYRKPQTVEEITDYFAERILRQVGLGSQEYAWDGVIDGDEMGDSQVF